MIYANMVYNDSTERVQVRKHKTNNNNVLTDARGKNNGA